MVLHFTHEEYNLLKLPVTVKNEETWDRRKRNKGRTSQNNVSQWRV